MAAQVWWSLPATFLVEELFQTPSLFSLQLNLLSQHYYFLIMLIHEYYLKGKKTTRIS